MLCLCTHGVKLHFVSLKGGRNEVDDEGDTTPQAPLSRAMKEVRM